MSLMNAGTEHASRIWPRTSVLPQSPEEAFLRAATFHLHFLQKAQQGTAGAKLHWDEAEDLEQQ